MAPSAQLFSPADYETLTSNNGAKLKRVVEQARAAENAKVEPTLRSKHEMFSLLVDFIKQRGRIVYGGYAINQLIRAKAEADAIYDFSSEAPDIEFYSSDAVVDARDLCDMFHAKGFPYIRGTEAFHAETYKVTVNLVQLCDITYVPKNIQRAIPYVVIDGMKFAHPHFLFIDSLRIITDPLTSYWRLDKAFPRMYLLQKHYPLDPPGNHVSNMTERNADPDVQPVIAAGLNFLRDRMPDGVTAIMVGYAAFDRFAMWAGQDQTRGKGNDLPFLEVVVTDYAQAVPALFASLRNDFGEGVEYEEFQRFFDYCGRRGNIYFNKKLAIRVFHHNNRCTPVLPVSDDGVESATLRTATLSVTALYLMVSKMILRASIPPGKHGQAVCDSLLYELYAMRAKFMDGNQQDVAGDHPFREFSSSCVGNSVGTLRAHKEETEYRRARPGLFGMAYFVYEPTQPPKYDVAEYKYMNSSGNPVKNAGDRLFNPDVGLVPNSESLEGGHHDPNRSAKAHNMTGKDHKNNNNIADGDDDGDGKRKKHGRGSSPKRSPRGARRWRKKSPKKSPKK